MKTIAVATPKIMNVITSPPEGIVGRAGSVRFMTGIVGWNHGRKPANHMTMRIVQKIMEPKAIRYLCFMVKRFSRGEAIGGFIGETVSDVEGGVLTGGVLMN